MSHLDDLQIIDEAKEIIKSSDAIKEIFKKYQLDLNEIDYVPICFAELEVSARTEKGIIYLNDSFRKKRAEIPNYLIHEMTHYAQQTTGDGPTQGSTDDTYLDNKYEQEGFQTQTKYLSETKGDGAAEQYLDKVLDYHDIKNMKERKNKFKKLLRLSD